MDNGGFCDSAEEDSGDSPTDLTPINFDSNGMKAERPSRIAQRVAVVFPNQQRSSNQRQATTGPDNRPSSLPISTSAKKGQRYTRIS